MRYLLRVSSHTKYRLALPGLLRFPYQTLPVACVTTELASDQIVLQTEQPLEGKLLSTARLELEWPVNLPDGAFLKLCLWGSILQVQDTLVELSIQQYEFRTRARRKGVAA